MVAQGDVFGKDQPMILHLLDIPPMASKVDAVAMEVEDLAAPLVHAVVPTTDYETAFKDVQVALLVGARPRGPGMERKDLLQANAEIFRGQGKALNDFADRNVKVLVVGNPANTNCLLAMSNAPSIPRDNFSALTRLDQNRTQAQVAKKLGVKVSSVDNCIIWGNHSATQYPDVRFATVSDTPSKGAHTLVPAALGEEVEWMRTDLIATVQQRGKRVIEARGASSAASAAWAICDHMRDWWHGSGGRTVSMAVVTDGNPYGVAENLVFSFPVRCAGGGRWEIVSGVEWDDFSREKIRVTEEELVEEREAAMAPRE